MADDRDDSDDSVVPFKGPAQHPSNYPSEEEEQPSEGVPEQFDLDFSWMEPDEEAEDAEGEEEFPTADETTDESEGEPSDQPDADSDEYAAATTSEYEDLARAVDEADEAEHEPQAVAVVVPGIEHGVVGFEDVTGTEAEPEGPEEPDFLTRVATGVALAAVFVVALIVPQPGVLAALVGIVALGGLLEFYSTVRGAGFNPMVLIGVVGSATILAGSWAAGSDGPYAAAALSAGTIAVLMLWYVLTGMRRPLENGSLTLLGVLWIALAMSFAMPIIHSPDYQPLVLFIVVVNAALDIGSYFIGRGMGRTRLAPALSPTKTVEGLVGGAVIALGIGAGLTAVSYFDVLELSQALILAVVIVVFSPLGDLTESLVKRSLGVKDMGSILPGHGGLLDRVDGLILVLPAAYYALFWMGIVQ
ncbi:MAG: phosphatidate cytidylyltransferase [Acidimicrobiia bacterium]